MAAWLAVVLPLMAWSDSHQSSRWLTANMVSAIAIFAMHALAHSALEGSNVSAIETMVAMITAARQFEHQMKLLQTAERQEQTAAKLLSANGM